MPSVELTPGAFIGMTDISEIGADTNEGRIKELCQDAVKYGFPVVCVSPYWARTAAGILRGACKVCTVIAYPLGATTTEVKVVETKGAIIDGAVEIDVALNIGAFKSGDKRSFSADIKKVVVAAQGIVVKAIIQTNLLRDEEIQTICYLVREAGASGIKTCAGFGAVVKKEQVELIHKTAPEMQIVAAGGIRTIKDVQGLIQAGANRLGINRQAALAILEEFQEQAIAG